MKFTNAIMCTAALAVSLFWGGQAQAGVEIDPATPDYAKTTGGSSNLDSIGLDTLNNLMTFWAESFRKKYLNVLSSC